MKRLLSLGFWIGLIYILIFSKVNVVQSFVNTSMVGVYLHVVMICLLIIGFFAYLLRIIHFLFVSQNRKTKNCYEQQRTPAASQKRISWLKFEPRVSNFPVTKNAIAVLVTCAIMTIFYFSIYFLKEEQRTLVALQK